ncbi:MAG TPA: hypothetical protein VN935_02095, partial [Rhizomicrobium sp.]|nr:hypothetical protein [Rhizomicrobium sp.]
ASRTSSNIFNASSRFIVGGSFAAALSFLVASSRGAIVLGKRHYDPPFDPTLVRHVLNPA